VERRRESTSLNRGNHRALTVKLDRAYQLLKKDKDRRALRKLNRFVGQVDAYKRAGKLTQEEAAALDRTAAKLISNVSRWQ
jgi:hypothetical protein